MYYVYFIALDNGDIYKGLTDDLKRRWKEHLGKKVKSTSSKDKLTLLGYEAYVLKSDVQRRERFLKTNEGRKLLKRQYRDIIAKLLSKD